jgi:hypothetical protein
VLAGFNPRSLWGLARVLQGGERGYPWNGNFLNISRVKDWMALLGIRGGGWQHVLLPAAGQSRQLAAAYLRFMEPAGDRWWAMGGGVYFLQAVKRVQGMNIILPQWKTPVAQRLLSPAAKVVNLKQYRVRRER